MYSQSSREPTVGFLKHITNPGCGSDAIINKGGTGGATDKPWRPLAGSVICNRQLTKRWRKGRQRDLSEVDYCADFEPEQRSVVEEEKVNCD